jgi:1-acyl-sn-glycerol-3-phosphate acyltransferase
MPEPSPPSPPIPWQFTGRGIWRVGRLLGVMVVGALGYFLRPSNRRTLAGRAAWLQRNCQRSLRALNVVVATRGEIPKGVLLTPNHVSYLDIIVLSALSPSVFVSKAEVGGWPIFGWFAKRAGTRFLRRDLKADLVRVGAELQPVIAEGINLVIFLEGTSTDGVGVKSFKPSLLEPAVREGWPVAPVAIRYVVPPGDDSTVQVAWWGTMPLAPHIVTMGGLAWIRAEVDFEVARAPGIARKALAASLQQSVTDQLGKP